jgi:hypothetical protein
MRKNLRPLLFLVCALVLPLLWVSAAQAISIIKVREIYAGPNQDSYVELQAYSIYYYAGATIPGKSLILFDDAGNPTVRFTFTEKNNNGAENTRFLVGDTNAQSTFGSRPDVVDPQMNIDPSGGAVCWNVGDTPVDCAAWGAFHGQAALEAYAGSPVGNPAFPGGIPPGKALERTEAPNCPTWLEREDDTDDSATDFLEATPNPQGPDQWESLGLEHLCESGMPDDTAIVEKPSNPSNDTSPHIGYTATGATSYQCKLDSATQFSTCPADGVDYSGLADGPHSVVVRALNGSGPDATPAQYEWSIDTVAPEATVVAHPDPVGFGKSATFAFSSDEPGSTFLCSLDSAPASSCRSGIRLTSLGNGAHSFGIAAVDGAGNVQASPTTYNWTTDTSLPVTTIDGRPDSPAAGPIFTFSYHASRPDSVFECSMDAAAFSSCPTSGASYAGLSKGTHTFAVRAVDSDNEVEASPPSYSFVVGSTPPARKPRCKKGFRRKSVHGAVKCVKVRHRKRHSR